MAITAFLIDEAELACSFACWLSWVGEQNFVFKLPPLAARLSRHSLPSTEKLMSALAAISLQSAAACTDCTHCLHSELHELDVLAPFGASLLCHSFPKVIHIYPYGGRLMATEVL